MCALPREAVVNKKGPLLTAKLNQTLQLAARDGVTLLECSLDLDLSTTVVDIGRTEWCWQGQCYPYLAVCREHTVYHRPGELFEPVARFATSLIKLVPTPWGPPTFEIDGIKMLPTAEVSPWEDARRKIALIRPRGKVILDTCGGLGYFAAWCLRGAAARVMSFEKNADVIWLRSVNPWSPGADSRLTLTHGDIVEQIAVLESDSVDAALHDPPRFGIAGELYSQAIYAQLARVLKRGGQLFHYTGAPNRKASGRELSEEVATRLRSAGFAASPSGDGVLAVNRKSARPR
jgi:predicted methyltransferase